MNTLRALLTPLTLALLTACGGGGDDAQPETPQALLWQGFASHVDPVPGDRIVRSVTMRPAPALSLATGVRGRECVEGVWTQQATMAGTFRLEMRAESFAIQPGGAVFTVAAGAAGPGTVEVPFRMCGGVDIPFAGARSAALSITARATNGSLLGPYSVTARWFVEGVAL